MKLKKAAAAGALIALTLLSGCSSSFNSSKKESAPMLLNDRQAFIDRGVVVELPAPVFKKELSARQLLTAEYKTGSASLVTLLKTTLNSLSLVGLSPAGIKLFSAQYNGEGIRVERFVKLDSLPPVNQVVLDIMLGLGPAAELEGILPADYEILDDSHKRILSHKGRTVYIITYQNNDSRQLPVCIENTVFDYKIVLNNI
ncbi:MAG: DUF3261 domain-containing protein [Succinivibrio sp.]|nr:DUF3261 domain-containing protein [Succinivibrio sp.]